MAKMFPPVIKPSAPNDEKRVFQWFSNAPHTENWIVFHSLGLDHHISQARGEIDFLVCAPEIGIFALEVKGGTTIRRDENGVWHFAYGSKRSPFEQVSDARSSLHDEYLKPAGLGKILFEYGVMFPSVEFNNSDPDVCQTIIFDKRDHGEVFDYIMRLSRHYKAKHQKTSLRMPTSQDLAKLKLLLRKPFDLDVIEPLSSKLQAANERAIRLTNEQYKIVDSLSNNKRLLVYGAAGTGKTILAKYDAMSSIQKGEKVGLFCFNLLLSEKMKEDFSDQIKENKIVVGSFTEDIKELAIQNCLVTQKDIEHISPNELSAFYKEKLPSLILDVIKPNGILFDKIIIDECQDLFRDNYLILLDEMLLGGLRNGKWSFYGDFDYQNIYNRSVTSEKALSSLSNYASGFASFMLTINCRNTPSIQNEMNVLLNLNRKALSSEDRYFPAVKWVRYSNVEEGTEKLDKELAELWQTDNISPERITIISPHTLAHSMVSKSKHRIKEFINSGMETGFSTIWKYKGLENDVIIITDIDNEAKDNPELLYTGMSRARGKLYIFEQSK